jgi:hypothetical protein
MTLSDIKSMTLSDIMTSNTRSRPIRIPVRRKSLRSIHKGNPEGDHISISRDLAKLEKLTRTRLLDKAMKEIDTGA